MLESILAGAISGGIIALITGLITFAMKSSSIENKVNNIENTLGKSEHEGLRKTVGDIDRKLVACETRLQEREPLAKRKSPLSLTERGLKLYKESGGEKYIELHRGKLAEEIKRLNPQTAYDVQEQANKVLAAKRDDSEFVPIKDFAFKHGETLDDILYVMAIPLRDYALPILGFNIKDLDK